MKAAGSVPLVYEPLKTEQPLKYPHRLNLYSLPPIDEILLEEFEDLAMRRIARRKRVGAGFYSRNVSYSSRKRFTIRYRYNSLTSDEKLKFFQASLPSIQVVEESEKSRLHQYLAASGSGSTQDVYYKVPFEHVADLVSKRAVYLSYGMAYVPRQDSLSILLSLFRSTLERNLEDTNRLMPRLSQAEEDRLFPMLLALSKAAEAYQDSLTVSHRMGSSSTILSSDIDSHSLHFPPCMFHLHSKLKEDSHLKHGGRMQYGLFLKSIGLSLEEAIVYWKRAFSRKITEDSFSKNYLYNIRHNYGQEGKRVNYPPYSCHKIITTNMPSVGDHHGCPFKHFPSDRLGSLLVKMAKLRNQDMSQVHLKEILDLSSSHHYQIACTRFFELLKNKSQSETISYPHQFFEWSKEEK